jgi:hypothetical protein
MTWIVASVPLLAQSVTQDSVTVTTEPGRTFQNWLPPLSVEVAGVTLEILPFPQVSAKDGVVLTPRVKAASARNARAFLQLMNLGFKVPLLP